MPRKPLIRSSTAAYLVTCRSRECGWFGLSSDLVWKIALGAITKAQESYPVRVHAFVLTPKSYQILLTTPQANLDCFMFKMNHYLSRWVRIRSLQSRSVLKGRYQWQMMESRESKLEALSQLYQVPLRNGLISRCENYPYSTLYYYVRKIDLGFNLDDPLMGESAFILDRFNQLGKT
jgi:putative transposase